MTLEQVWSELGDDFIDAAESLGHEPAEMLAAVLSDFIVKVHNAPRQPLANPGIIPPRRQRDARDKEVSGFWANREETGLEAARRIRDANNRGRHYVD